MSRIRFARGMLIRTELPLGITKVPIAANRYLVTVILRSVRTGRFAINHLPRTVYFYDHGHRYHYKHD